MKAKIVIAGVAALILTGCEKPAPPLPPPPTALEIFRGAEQNANGQFSLNDAGRFVPMNFGKIAILDTKLGNVWYYDFDAKSWVKIPSPLMDGSNVKIEGWKSNPYLDSEKK